MFFANEDIAAVILAPERNGTFWSNQDAQKSVAEDFSRRLTADLGLSAVPERISDGLFQDAFVFRVPKAAVPPEQQQAVQRGAEEAGLASASGKVPFLVAPYFITEGNENRAFANVFVLVELPSCYLRDAQIRWLESTPKFEQEIPEPLKAKEALKLLSAPLRVTHSPVRLSFRGNEASQALKLSRIFGEAYAAQQSDAGTLEFPIRSELLAKACAFFGKPFVKNMPGEGEQRYRVHRDLISLIPDQGEPEVLFSGGAPSCFLRSSPFSHEVPEADKQLEKAQNEYSPRACLDAFLAALQKDRASSQGSPVRGFLQQLPNETFEVVARKGRHVTLKSGRTSGLIVGSRLSGPNGERLHVIRLLRAQDALDSAIAYIRKENAHSPIGPGFKLSLDPRVFPLSSQKFSP